LHYFTVGNKEKLIELKLDKLDKDRAIDVDLIKNLYAVDKFAIVGKKG
jgi:hypothetical protein